MSYIRTATEDVMLWKLQYIKDHNYELPTGQAPFHVVHEILGILGSPDPELRDRFGYQVLSHLITDQNRLTSDELRDVLTRMLSEEMLFGQIGEIESDSVFRRSFSALVVALVLIRDNQHDAFLTADEVRQVAAKLIRYCEQEVDLRGYVPGSGWAHAAAHISDAIDECIRSRHTERADCEQLWQGLRALIWNANELYICEEDERMAIPLVAMVELGKVPLDTICDWLEQEQVSDSSALQNDIRRLNWKQLTRSLYFRLHKQGLLGDHAKRLFKTQDLFTLY